jgi:hypothetical protein
MAPCSRRATVSTSEVVGEPVSKTRAPPSRLAHRPRRTSAHGAQVPSYVLRLRFEDGLEVEGDLKPHRRFTGVLEPLRDPACFAQVRVDAELGASFGPMGRTWPRNIFTRSRGVAPRAHQQRTSLDNERTPFQRSSSMRVIATAGRTRPHRTRRPRRARPRSRRPTRCSR